MREISLHIIDVVQNSISANADIITLVIEENVDNDILKVVIKDDGCGIDDEMLKNVKDPFITSRKTRKVGLGLSLFEAACQRCDGYLEVKSKIGTGTEVTAVMKYNHIDRAPIGRMSDTITTLLLTPDVDIVYKHKVDDKEFVFDTREIKTIVGDDLLQPEILHWIKEYVDENLQVISAKLF